LGVGIATFASVVILKPAFFAGLKDLLSAGQHWRRQRVHRSFAAKPAAQDDKTVG
jgi:hypothetical protein